MNGPGTAIHDVNLLRSGHLGRRGFLTLDVNDVSQYLDSAADLRDLMIPPSNELEALRGDREGQYSIRINKQWRVCFKWKDGDALEVEIVDYH